MNIRIWVLFLVILNVIVGIFLLNEDSEKQPIIDTKGELDAAKISKISMHLEARKTQIVENVRRPLTPINRATTAAVVLPKASEGEKKSLTVNPVRRDLSPKAKAVTSTVKKSSSKAKSSKAANPSNSGVCLVVGTFSPKELKSWRKRFVSPRGVIQSNTIWTLHTQFVSTKTRAQQVANQLKVQKKMRMTEVSSRAPWRVTLGRFSRKIYAQKAQQKLRKRGIATYIMAVKGRKKVIKYQGLNARSVKKIEARVKENLKVVRKCR